ncbi:MAG: tannase/feruloyl esterase family alpha/beta hydrolase [Eubacterium sp.]|nr:tannase/feruloyl esterase family alpha/beta hydrolase [Eubacterium sp.]MDD7210390.1 tannase/feruloyl esterase family alpha/beta hydrolase [Lachnospiraceae bacterium]MDY5496944.1 tannase/feruloyl esterase family alpha/beta hydrolase [Anaerobutyricum sp.]
MNGITKWYEHRLFYWMDGETAPSMEKILKENCTEEKIRRILDHYENITLENIEFYSRGTYSEPEKVCLDNIPDFYVIRMKQQVSKNHHGTFRVYLPVRWNRRFMGITGAGTNNEVDWFSSVTFNVISWPMAVKNGYACAVADNDTGIRLDCTWGFDAQGKPERDHIMAWAYDTAHEMTVCAKELLMAVYGEKPLASYMQGTSGGARQVITEAVKYPEDYDGLWADGPAINHYDLVFACLWAAVVEANEKHIVPLSKYKAAFALATAEECLKDYPFNSRDMVWMNFINRLIGYPTEDGPITRRDLQVMVKTWDGPFTKDGKRMGYGFGPAIRQWPLEQYNQFYGYLTRKEDGKLGLMPIAEQLMRWFTGNPDFDVYRCTYEEYERIYTECKKEFREIHFKEADFSAFAAHGGKLMITQGTGDCVVPYQAAIDYYNDALDYFPSERIMNESVRMFMPYLAGHSILDWSGPAVSISEGMKVLTDWVEQGQAPEIIPTIRYDFQKDEPVCESSVEVFRQWEYKKRRNRSSLSSDYGIK